MGVPSIEILILIVFSHSVFLTAPDRHLMSSVNNQLMAADKQLRDFFTAIDLLFPYLIGGRRKTC